eukprot:1147859-Pelagomonas_calceolata.AAC.5
MANACPRIEALSVLWVPASAQHAATYSCKACWRPLLATQDRNQSSLGTLLLPKHGHLAPATTGEKHMRMQNRDVSTHLQPFKHDCLCLLSQVDAC